MTSTIIDGKKLSEEIIESLKQDIKNLEAKGISTGLAVVLVGSNPASQVYVKRKRAACEKTGIKSFSFDLPEETTTKQLLKLIRELNVRPDINGILVQLPLPKHIDESTIISAIDPDKDVDGFHPINAGKLLVGEQGLRPCTPSGIMAMIDSLNIEIRGMNAVVIGRSNIVGKPISIMLLERHATVTICHSRTENIPDIVGSADILIAALGKPNFVQGSWIKEGAIVIDVGINRMPDGKLTGDVDFGSAAAKAGAISPVPGGVGPMTIALLLSNTVKAARMQNHISKTEREN